MREIHLYRGSEVSWDAKAGRLVGFTTAGRVLSEVWPNVADVETSDVAALETFYADTAEGRALRAVKRGPDKGEDMKGPAILNAACKAALLFLLALLMLPACASAQGFARGAYGVEYAAVRGDLATRTNQVVEAAKAAGVDVDAIRALVKATNATDPGAGTGALVQVVLIRLALELATGGSIDTQPAQAAGGEDGTGNDVRAERSDVADAGNLHMEGGHVGTRNAGLDGRDPREAPANRG